jgi:hypothetical protein
MAENTPDPEEPVVVYHYASIGTMMTIVENAEVWATSISYLNDVSERDHYLQLIRDRTSFYRQTHTLPDESIFEDLLDADNPDDLGFLTRPFVASFSQEDDSLPQWRSYCPQGNGVAVGFSVDCLKRSFLNKRPVDPNKKAMLTVKQRLSFHRVDYSDASNVQSLDDDITKTISESLQSADGDRIPEEDNRYSHAPSLYFKVIMEGHASFKKHPSFSAEREYRLLVDPIYWEDDYLAFRPTRSTLVPYLRVTIPRMRSDYVSPRKPFAFPVTRSHFIDRVVIGPTTNKNLSLDAVSSFFRKHNMNVDVASSKVPYRDW